MDKDKLSEGLFKFQNPMDVFTKVDHSNNSDDAIDFILHQKKRREAYAGSLFAIGYEKFLKRSIQFRLIQEQNDHDFEIKVGDNILPFQFTEQMEGGRKRDKEYKLLNVRELILRAFRPKSSQAQAVNWLIKRIEEKISKRYSDKPHLLVYCNFSVSQMEFLCTAAEVAKIKNLDSFISVWIFVTTDLIADKYCIGRLFPNPVGWIPYRITADN